jgi:hypothetical protein
MKKLRMILALILAGTITISLLSRLLPAPGNAEVSEFYSETATSVVLIDALLAMGSAILFLIALKSFKPDLKPAYRLMAFSTLGVGLGMLLFPYIEYNGLWENLAWNMSSYLQYLIGAPLMYFGVRMFSKKVGLSGWPTWLGTLFIGLALLLVVHYFLPHDIASYWPFSRIQFNLFKLATLLPIIAYGLAALMALRLRLRTGSEYKMAFTWLSLGMAFYVVSNIGIALIEVIGYESWYISSRAYTTPNILGDICVLLAGYCFAAIGRPRDSVVKSDEPVTSMDIIIYAAGMASDQSKIDSFLDDMRLVTAHVHPGEAPSSEDQKKLREAYLGIENVLVSSDPLRTFKKDELRDTISRHFGLAERGDQTFWPSL